MNHDTFPWLDYVESMAALQGLALAAEQRAEVIRQMIRIEAMARRFIDFPLETEVQPAPVFRP